MEGLPNKIDYTDFYKFSVSGSITIFIASVWALSLNLPLKIAVPIAGEINISQLVFFVIAVISGGFMAWSVNEWRQRQKKLDDYFDKREEQDREFRENRNKDMKLESERKRKQYEEEMAKGPGIVENITKRGV